ncbi:MAG: hypothetical protein J6T05_01765 [Prevotella sp.]|nr:hypothetical protein [Prevotella sp.]
MKRNALLLFAVLASCMTMNANTIINNENESNANNGSMEINQSTTSSTDDTYAGGLDIDYYGVEKGWGVGVEVHKGFLLGFIYNHGETNDYVTSNYSWGMHLGYNYRYWIIPNSLYIEGRFGVGYADAKLEITTTTTKTRTTEGRYIAGHYLEGKTYTYEEKQKENLGGSDFYLMMSPRIGLNLFKFKNGGGVALTGGYRWTFTKFKFDKEHKADYFSAGICIIY